MKMSRNY